MDPFTAIGLAGNIIAFIDFGFEVVSAAREIYGSNSGATSENKDLEFLTGKVNNLALNLQPKKSKSQMTGDECNLNNLAVECTRLSHDLLDLLKGLKARKTSSTKESLRAVWRNTWKKKEKTELEKKLESCRQLLHLQLTSTARSETLQRLDQVMRSGECQEKELASLRWNLDVLRSSLDAKHLSSEDLDQVRSLLNLSDQAIAKVCQNLILDGLRFEKMNDRFDEVKKAHLKTFNWILGKPDDDSDSDYNDDDDDDESDRSDSVYISHDAKRHRDEEESCQLRLQARDNFVNWLENGNGIFHVSGKPGAGKSTLMKYLCQHPRTEKLAKVWSGEKQLVFAKFFFWRPGSGFQKSMKGLLRGLLHCILDQSPDLIEVAFPEQWESAKYQRRIQFDESKVQQAFNWIIQQKAVYDKCKFVFFIDGLDEFDGDPKEMIRQLFSWVSARPNDIKICASSREELIFQERFSKCPKIRLHELTRQDIAIFVKDTLAANEDLKSAGENDKDLAKLQEQIIEKSEGVFLWVSLAIRTLEQGLLAEDRIQDLQEKIDVLPAELDELFQFIFDSMTKGSNLIDCRNAIRTLAITTRLQRLPRLHEWGLSLMRYSFLEDFQDDPHFAIKRPIYNMSKDDILQRLRRSRKQVYARCKGFLEVVSMSNTSGVSFRGEVVNLVHRSLAEFLQKEDTQKRMAPHLLDFVLDFFLDLESLDSTRFCGFLDQLACVVIARVPAEKTGSILADLPRSWSRNSRILQSVSVTDCHPSTYIRFYAMKYGLYEYFLGNTADGVVEPHHRHRERDEILSFALSTVSWPSVFSIIQDRLAKTLGYCFEHGISANSRGGFLGTASCWQRVIWTLMATTKDWKTPGFEFEPIIRVFLLYGAEPYFWLRFGPRYRNKEGQEFICVVPQVGTEGEEKVPRFGMEREEEFNEIYIDVDSESIVQFAKEKGWKLSLRDIVAYWFPKRAKVLQELIDRNAARHGDPEEDEVKELKAMSHLDLDVWKGLGYEEDKHLFTSFMDKSDLEAAGFDLSISY